MEASGGPSNQPVTSFEICRGKEKSQTWAETLIGIKAKLQEGNGPFEGNDEDQDLNAVAIQRNSSNQDDPGQHADGNTLNGNGIAASNESRSNGRGSDSDDDDNDGNDTIVSSFLLRVDDCFGTGSRAKLPERSFLRIIYKKHSARLGGLWKSWLSLSFEQVFKAEEHHILQYEFKVETALHNSPPGIANKKIVFEGNKIVFPDGIQNPQQVLMEKIIQLQDWISNGRPSPTPSQAETQPVPQPMWTATVSVTPVIIVPHCNRPHQEGNQLIQNPGHPNPHDGNAQLCIDLKDMFMAEENYPDIDLKMQDGVTLTAHRFILVGRCPVLGELIESAVASGNIVQLPLPDVNAEPMSIILKWMYTAELEEEMGDTCLEEVIKAADKFKLAGLLKLLDKKVISICSIDNAFRLGQICCRWRSEMPTGFAVVSKFLRDDIGIPLGSV